MQIKTKKTINASISSSFFLSLYRVGDSNPCFDSESVVT